MAAGRLRVRVLSVGRDKEFTAEGVAEYARRLQRAADLELTELRAADGPNAKELEADAILAAAQKERGELWALDAGGTQLSSEELAQRLGRVRDAALGVTLVIGGDEGLSTRVHKAARLVWSLSRLTLPHRIARLVAVEQVYRALEILRGSPYHK